MIDSHSNEIMLISRKTGQEKLGYYRRLDINDLDALEQLEAENQRITNSKDMCVDVTENEFLTYIKPDRGIYYGMFVEDQLIAMYCIIRPIPSENLGIHKGLEGKELDYVAHWELAHVLPEYRGNGLQKFLSEQCNKCLLKYWKNVKYLFVTIYPFNYPSLISTLKFDFKIIGLEEKYDGHLRYILYKQINCCEIFSEETAIEVLCENIEEQKKCFSNGYLGTEIIDRDGSKYIQLKKMVK